MTWNGTLRWIGPAPTQLCTFASWRVWRWTDDEYARLHVADMARVHGPDDPRRRAPGFEQPGLALFDGGGQPVCAASRHARLRDDNKTLDDALLVPAADNTWTRVGVASAETRAVVLRDAQGVERARRAWTGNVRAVPVDKSETLTAGSSTWRVADIRGGRDGWLGALLGYRCAGVRLLDSRGGAVRAEVTLEGARPWEGDVTAPLLVRWDLAPDPWALGAFALLVNAVIDATHGGHHE